MKVKPSSEGATSLRGSDVRPGPGPERENAWNPPESVSMARGHFVNPWSPPWAAMVSGPGLSQRWYVLPRTICAPVLATSSTVSVFTLPCVPTGMKVGSSTTAFGVVSMLRRAWPSV